MKVEFEDGYCCQGNQWTEQNDERDGGLQKTADSIFEITPPTWTPSCPRNLVCNLFVPRLILIRCSWSSLNGGLSFIIHHEKNENMFLKNLLEYREHHPENVRANGDNYHGDNHSAQPKIWNRTPLFCNHLQTKNYLRVCSNRRPRTTCMHQMCQLRLDSAEIMIADSCATSRSNCEHR